jgi:WD40 repeat protein
VAFSPNSRTLASASLDATVRLWDVAAGQELAALRDHEGHVLGVAFSPDGAALASCGADGVVRLWALPGGKLKQRLTGHTSGATWVAFHPGGKFLASASRDGTVRVWEAATGKSLNVLPIAKTDDWITVAFSPDGRWLAAGTDDFVRLWDAAFREVHNIPTPAAGLVAFSPDGEVLLTTVLRYKDGAVHRVKRWETASGKEVGSWPVRTGYGWGCHQLSPDGKTVAAVSGYGRVVHLHDAVTGEPRFPADGHTDAVDAVAFSPDGRLLASGGLDSTALLWDLATGRESRRLSGHTGWVRGVAFSPDGDLLATSSFDRTVRLWEVKSGKHLWTFKDHSGEVERVAFSPDGKLLAAGARDGVVWVWDVAGRTPVRVFRGLSNVAAAVAFSPDSRRLAAAAEDARSEGFVRVWNLAGGAAVRTLAHPGRATGVAFLPDGEGLITTGEHGEVHRWSLASAELRQTLWGGGGFAWGLAVSGDGRLLASSGDGGVARVWDLGADPPRRQTFRLFPYEVRVDAVAISPEGRYLATGNPDGTIHLFRLAPPGRKRAELPRADDRDPPPIPKGASAWTEANLRAGKVSAPDLSKARLLHHDEFGGKDGPFDQAPGAEAGYEKGRLYIKGDAYCKRGWMRSGSEYGDFACRVEGRVLAPASDGWALAIDRTGARSQGVQISLDSEARLRVSPWVYDADPKNNGPRVGPLTHAAIRKGDAFNELLVVVRGRRMEVYVNGVAVCPPVTVDRDFTPGHLILQSLGGDKGVHVEFKRITVWAADGLPEPLLEGEGKP